MCGIAAIFNIKEQTPDLRNKALSMAKKIRHRGPDWSGIYCGGSAILAHERLSIVDPQSGGQPLYSPDRKQILAVNGEIYNHQEIRKRYQGKYSFQTGSDCEVILALYQDKGINFLEDLNGIFAFALYDEARDEFLIARDPIGVIPLYIGFDKEGKVYCASELKALEGFCDAYEPFLPGHYYSSREGKMTRWYRRDWMEYGTVSYTLNHTETYNRIKESLEAAVRRQLMSDVPYGVLLSGGLDSSVISAVAKKYASRRIESNGKQEAWWPQLHSFAIGLKGAPDLAKAREVADFIGTVHHEINYTIQEGLDALCKELEKLDPQYYEIVDKRNVRRVLHGLEICIQTGKPYSSFRTSVTKKRNFNVVKIVLNRPREELYTRINDRVDKMMDAGLLDEAKALYPFKDSNALNTVGYKELFAYIEGKYTLDEAVERIKGNTRRYARKQLTWFKKYDDAHWYNPDDKDAIMQYISQI